MAARAFGAAVLMLALLAGSAQAADHLVQLRDRGPGGGFVFDPMLLRVAPGDRVTFAPADRGHSSASIPGMAPAGAEAWHGKLDAPVTVAFRQPGVYGVLCAAHYALGMVGPIVVGDPSPNLAEARTVDLPAMAQARMDVLLAQVY